jgi:diphthamide synthase subunit DPH2
MIFLADGRFHLEAAMISNPSLRALRYDPYSKTLTEEKYEIVKMKRLRREAVEKVRGLLGISCGSMTRGDGQRNQVANDVSNIAQSGEDIANSLLSEQPTISSSSSCSTSNNNRPPKTIGIILGTLGRQGNPGILARIRSLLHKRGVRTMIVLLSEIFPKKLEMLSGGSGGVCAWVQIACPRLR